MYYMDPYSGQTRSFEGTLRNLFT